MFYQFKAQSSDFIVEELLSAQPSGKGEVLYVYFQKEHLTTMAVLEHLQRSLPLSRENLGIAGLKDKAGITRQWITVFKSTLEKVGGETRFLSVLSELTTVLKTTWGDVPLRIGGNGGNRFEVRLRAREAVGAEKKNLIVQNAEQVKIKGFPNCFGFQRFGKGMKNFREAKEVIQGKENR
ncbi:MAG: tRNA pseudouridine(13) synthase TruD [Candidatus Peribacteria bacterium]|jgi:tRNA pseudouridine13 synthase|nr:tRNA pseudouridine(13) synthase TruD [Candidatus Peribacteria bacterium]